MVVLLVTADRKEVRDAGRVSILNAAARLFREQGYAAVSLRAIASAAGMKAGSIYYHFASKDLIVVEILNGGILAVHERVSEAIAGLPDDAPVEEILRAGIRGHLEALFEHGDFTSANVRIFGQVPENVRTVSLPTRRDYDKFWDDLLAKLQSAGKIKQDVDLRIFRLLLIGALNATLEWFDRTRGGTSALADQYADFLLNGLLEKAETTA